MIRLEALGGLRVFQAGTELRTLPSKPLRTAMFVYLAIEREASRERICHLLWPESAPAKARHALSQTLHELKKELGDGWFESVAERLRATDGVESDVHALLEAGEDGRHEDVVALYRGAFLEGAQLGGGVEFERWIEDERAAVHRAARQAFRHTTASATDAERRVGLAEAWVRLDPLDDEAQHALVEALATAGRRTEALERYRLYSELIAEELELQPLDQTKELVEEIRTGTFSQPAPAEAGEVAPGPPPHPTDGDARSGREVPVELPADLDVARVIGRGTTGSVYLAREPSLKRLVAIKVLDPELAEHPTARARFEREAQAAAGIVHPHVAGVHRVGQTPDGAPYFVMPYIRGVTLADRIRALGPLSTRDVRRLLAETASALAAAHAAGIVHRDVRPANVLYEEDTGRTYLVDFGMAAVLESGGEELARLTRTGELLGNPEYISPEQRRGANVDGRSDVYSLGVMGRELLFGRGDDQAFADGGCDDVELLDLLGRATSDNPRHRPSAAEFASSVAPIPAEGGDASLFDQLRDRRMFHIVAAYLAGGVAGMGGVDQLVQQDIFPPIAYRLALAFFVAGLNAAIVVGWFHGKRGRQRISRPEMALLTVIFVGWLIASTLILS